MPLLCSPQGQRAAPWGDIERSQTVSVWLLTPEYYTGSSGTGFWQGSLAHSLKKINKKKIKNKTWKERNEKTQTSFWLDATFAILHDCTEQENKKVKVFRTLSFPRKAKLLSSHKGLSNSVWEKDRLPCLSPHPSSTDKTHCPTTLNLETCES